MSNLEEMKAAIEAFCIAEYGRAGGRMTGDDFRLFAVDCGGYDVTSDVILEINGDDITLNVGSKTFTLKLEE